MLDFLLLIAGLLGLWAGTEMAVRNALAIAEALQLSQLLIGLTILAIGTDLPEVVVTLNASADLLNGIETSGIIMGNAVGSSIANISLVLGLAGLAGYLQIARSELLSSSIWLTGGLVLLFILGADGAISRPDGLLMLAVYAAYCYTLFSQQDLKPARAARLLQRHMAVRLIQLMVGILLLVLASEYVVDSAIRLAQRWDIEQSLIALLIIGPGTSLPEIAVSVSAIAKKATALSVGNILGSNMFNSLALLGGAGLIHPVAMEMGMLRFDLPILFLLTAASLFFFWHRKGLQRQEATVLLGAYLTYDVVKLLGL